MPEMTISLRHHPGRCRLKEEEEGREGGEGGEGGGSKELRPFDVVVSLVELRRDFLRTFARALRLRVSQGKVSKKMAKKKIEKDRQTDS
ncbi:hypothetical protein V1478_011820 [Vespula squamosa]|uniref:Uncharacterized protein n=1 Tax=Vespula squamosa TaxID=30214 RepID=A0ABD2ABF5_VESSQ